MQFYMTVNRDQPATGGPKRTGRQEIAPLVRRQELEPLGIEAEPEDYPDASPSVMWPWQSNPGIRTWDIEVAVLKEGLGPFAAMDSQAGKPGDEGGVFCYPFSNKYLQMGKDLDDGDLNPGNVDQKLAEWVARHWGPRAAGPDDQYGGTNIMAAVRAADERFCLGKKAEFRDRAPGDRPLRIRRVLTDGALQDEDAFISYLEQATLFSHPALGPSAPAWGDHGQWREVWAIAILGEDSDGSAAHAYQQYLGLQKKFPWIHPYFFQKVEAAAEIAEDLAMATVPQDA